MLLRGKPVATSKNLFILIFVLSKYQAIVIEEQDTRKLTFWDGIYERAKLVPPQAACLFYLRRTISLGVFMYALFLDAHCDLHTYGTRITIFISFKGLLEAFLGSVVR